MSDGAQLGWQRAVGMLQSKKWLQGYLACATEGPNASCTRGCVRGTCPHVTSVGETGTPALDPDWGKKGCKRVRWKYTCYVYNVPTILTEWDSFFRKE